MSRRPVDPQYLTEFVNQCYADQENNCGFCKKKKRSKVNVVFAKGLCW